MPQRVATVWIDEHCYEILEDDLVHWMDRRYGGSHWARVTGIHPVDSRIKVRPAHDPRAGGRLIEGARERWIGYIRIIEVRGKDGARAKEPICKEAAQ